MEQFLEKYNLSKLTENEKNWKSQHQLKIFKLFLKGTKNLKTSLERTPFYDGLTGEFINHLKEVTQYLIQTQETKGEEHFSVHFMRIA